MNPFFRTIAEKIKLQWHLPTFKECLHFYVLKLKTFLTWSFTLSCCNKKKQQKDGETETLPRPKTGLQKSGLNTIKN